MNRVHWCCAACLSTLLVYKASGSVVHVTCADFSGTCDCPSGKCDCAGWPPCWSLGWDIDVNGTIDMCFYPGQDCPSGCISFLYGGVAWPIDEGAIIGPDLEWTSSVSWSFDAGGCTAGPGCDDSIGPYVGLRFTDESGTHYGWMLGISNYAYETAFDTPIAAGAGPPLGDISGDGVVNDTDLAQLLALWGLCPLKGTCSADIAPCLGGETDGVVGPADLAALLANWS